MHQRLLPCHPTACSHTCPAGPAQARSGTHVLAGPRAATQQQPFVPVQGRASHWARPARGFPGIWATGCAPASGVHAAPPSAGGAGAHQAAWPLASLSRIFIGLPARHALARNLGRVAKPNGPLSVLIVLFTVVGALLAAIWRRIVSNVRDCSACRGFGIARCGLCRGMGSVGWEGKFRHDEPCPVCLGRRYTECQHCGGRWHRTLFAHARRDPTSFAESLQDNYGAVGARAMED